jgi:hypothetical protein
MSGNTIALDPACLGPLGELLQDVHLSSITLGKQWKGREIVCLSIWWNPSNYVDEREEREECGLEWGERETFGSSRDAEWRYSWWGFGGWMA